jgi:hypothetical protein
MPAYNLLIPLILIFLLVQIQLKGNKNFSRDFVLALGVSRDGPTTLSPDRLVQTYDWLLNPLSIFIFMCFVLFFLSIYIRCQ